MIYIIPNLEDSPKINCELTAAFIGDRDIYLSCMVSDRPRVTSIRWMIDGNGTKVAESDINQEYWVENMVSK